MKQETKQQPKDNASAFVGPDATRDVKVTGRRIIATIIDGLVFATLFILLDALLGSPRYEALIPHPDIPKETMSVMIASELVFGVYAVFIVLYYIVLEGYLGQTLGKMLVGIKVVREDNSEVLGVRAAAIRTLLRLIDGFLNYLVAFIAVLVSAKRQRLGDRLAYTLVVRKQRVRNFSDDN